MKTPKPPQGANVVPIRPPKAAKQESEKKWGIAAMALGFCILPALLLRAQKRLGLSPTQLALVIQLSDFWWNDGRNPWPSKETLGQRLGLSDRQVQRVVKSLEDRGYVTRKVRMTKHGRTSNAYDLSGLVAKLAELAPEFAAARAAKRKVERRGGLKEMEPTITPLEPKAQRLAKPSIKA